MKDLLMVIDMQKAYLKGAPWECLDTEGAAANIARLIDSGAADGAVFTRYEYPKAPVGVWKAYNELYADINADPVNEEFVDELLPYTERFPVYVKDVYGSFSDPATRAAVRESGADTLVVCGVVAECCVISTVCGAVDEGLKVIYLTDAVSGFTPEKMEGVLAVLSGWMPLHVETMTTDEYIASRAERKEKRPVMISIAAADRNWAIGKDGDLLVSIPEDMKFFRETTKGHTVVMGRKTLESFPGGRPLKGRVNVVLSRQMTPGETQVDERTKLVVLPGIEEFLAWAEASGQDEIYVIGGGSIYRAMLPYCSKALITFIRHGFEGADTHYPNLDEDPDWALAAESESFFWTPTAEGEPAGEAAAEPVEYSFRTYERINNRCY